MTAPTRTGSSARCPGALRPRGSVMAHDLREPGWQLHTRRHFPCAWGWTQGRDQRIRRAPPASWRRLSSECRVRSTSGWRSPSADVAATRRTIKHPIRDVAPTVGASRRQFTRYRSLETPCGHDPRADPRSELASQASSLRGRRRERRPAAGVVGPGVDHPRLAPTPIEQSDCD